MRIQQGSYSCHLEGIRPRRRIPLFSIEQLDTGMSSSYLHKIITCHHKPNGWFLSQKALGLVEQHEKHHTRLDGMSLLLHAVCLLTLVLLACPALVAAFESCLQTLKDRSFIKDAFLLRNFMQHLGAFLKAALFQLYNNLIVAT